jgi:hypothetical protein
MIFSYLQNLVVIFVSLFAFICIQTLRYVHNLCPNLVRLPATLSVKKKKKTVTIVEFLFRENKVQIHVPLFRLMFNLCIYSSIYMVVFSFPVPIPWKQTKFYYSHTYNGYKEFVYLKLHFIWTIKCFEFEFEFEDCPFYVILTWRFGWLLHKNKIPPKFLFIASVQEDNVRS